jgi:hypothetical protein
MMPRLADANEISFVNSPNTVIDEKGYLLDKKCTL